MSSSILMKNCSQLHHQSIGSYTPIMTQEARCCCWLPAPQTTHIQQEHYGQQENAPAHCAWDHWAAAKRNPVFYQTRPVASRQSWPKSYGLWDIREWCRKVFIRSQWGTLMSWSSVRLQRSRESNTASLIKQLISGENVLTHVSKPKATTLNNYFDVLSITVNLSGHFMLALLWLWTDWHMLCFTR